MTKSNFFLQIKFFYAKYLRRKGNYDLRTMSLYRSSCIQSKNPQKLLELAKFERDYQGYISQDLEEILKKINHLESNKHSKITQLLLETSHPTTTTLFPPHLPREFITIHMHQNKWRATLLEYLSHKTIAIVGNGVSLIDSCLGLQIESNDVVCRFNNSPALSKTKSDTGVRTDIWIVSPEVATSTKSPPQNIKWIILTGPDSRFTLKHWEWCKPYVNAGCHIVTVPIQIWNELVQRFQAPPSAGVLWITYLLSVNKLNTRLNLYGFDRTISTQSQYHITSKSYKPSSRHAWLKEREYLAEISSEKAVNWNLPDRIGVFTKGLYNNPNLRKQLYTSSMLLNPDTSVVKSLTYIIGWGRKQNTHPAINFANKHSLKYYTLEDGFIHSMSQGRLGAYSWSLVKDERGIYYDATQPSDLEYLINNRTLSEKEYARAKSCLKKIHAHQITKYNNGRLILPTQLSELKNAVLVIDQVDGDTSIPYAYAYQSSFTDMLTATLTENPNSPIILKVHPDVINGKRKGCIGLDALDERIIIVSENINAIVLLQVISKVYVVSSQMGFEALLLGKPVVCFGTPFYAGWGLTDDRQSSPATERRKARPDRLTVFHCAYIDYTRYIHPETHRPCELEAVIDHVALQNHYYRANAGSLICLGLTPWKRRFVKHFLQSNDNTIHFVEGLKQAQTLTINKQTKVFIWSSRKMSEAKELQSQFGCEVTQIEDGFIRSVGLGVNYTLPSSLAFDRQGIYFDPSEPSSLEDLLLTTFFGGKIIEKSKEITQLIVEKKVSKYNQVTNQGSLDKFESVKHPVILVPGQVADDASVQCGCPKIADNLSLLRLVRQRNPQATIIYKPHPDVVSGYRKGAISHDVVIKYCDYIIDDIPISDCLNIVTEVHTMTSLVGFEALLRGLQVHCYGIPFYAGWGLTLDEHTVSRRTRTLTVEELVAGSLLLYPRYYNWQTGSFSNAKTIIESLSTRHSAQQWLNKPLRMLPRSLRSLVEIALAMIKAR